MPGNALTDKVGISYLIFFPGENEPISHVFPPFRQRSATTWLINELNRALGTFKS
jgi:hypothetical protein